MAKAKDGEDTVTVTPAEDGGVIIELADAEGQHVDIEEPVAGSGTPAPAPAAAVTAPEVEVEPAQPEPKVSEAVEELRSQLKQAADREAAERRERLRAEQQARQHEIDAQRAQEESRRFQDEAVESRRVEIDAGIAAAQANVDAGRRAYEAAFAAGDPKAMSDANVAINRASAQLVFLEDRKSQVQVAVRQPTAAGRVEAPAPQPVAADPTEQYISSKTPRTQSWLRQHTECVTDPRMNNRAVAAYYEAMAEGYVADTDAYFDFMDRKLGFAGNAPAQSRQAPQRMTENTNDAPPPRKVTKPPAAAPVSRESPRSQELGNGRIYLNKGELDAAEALGLSPAEYGKRKAIMTKQGFYH